MSAVSAIEWTDRTWNPVRGCSVISPGCVNCYAMKQAHRFSGDGKAYAGLTKLTKAGPQWTGRIQLVESALLEPLSWKKPARVFVNSMSDLFHESVPDAFIDRVFAVMWRSSQHTFQVLTKRADRMRAYFDRVTRPIAGITPDRLFDWPLSNVWLGVSAEDQERADQRIPLLLQTPAAVRFISAEPLLGSVDLSVWLPCHRGDPSKCFSVVQSQFACCECSLGHAGVDWVIVGGESGPGARPFDLAWGRSIVEQCKAAGVPVFVKQFGRNPVSASDTDHGLVELDDRKGGDPDEWPSDLRVRQFPEARG